MLNRRLLRVKVMQALYAYFQSRSSDYYVAEEHIRNYFQPDLNSMTPPDYEALKRNTQIALRAFEQAHKTKMIEEGVSAEVQVAVQQAIRLYEQNIERDKRHFRRLLIEEIEGLYERYLSVLALLIELAKLVAAERERKPLDPTKVKVAAHYKLADNQIIRFLQENQELQEALKRYYISWQDEEETVKTLYRDHLRKDPTYIAYRDLPQASLEDDYNILDHIVRHHIFPRAQHVWEEEEGQVIEEEPFMYTFFEERDLKWVENRSALRSMVIKTLKSVNPDRPEDFRLLDLSLNWEDDENFILTLYNKTIEEEEENLRTIKQHLKGWEIERLLLVDKTLLQMAIVEMKYCPQIPVKVTINEFVELAKHYSSPKSRNFVNGLLDSIATTLQAEGQIRKSGRGLIDNQ
ncbi:MAG: N utilization substance protein B [Thermonema sp.]|uniref:transcription antitermination factor NusB n=1 Tax=Thermonema sp. TaxID=2231181 RepID=UPI0021DF32A3|nr:transcription antitermination factor NusB [Thermonema sp.]GIV39015.1 MAG: N utilization substance protein B [Thermonema sp.]